MVQTASSVQHRDVLDQSRCHCTSLAVGRGVSLQCIMLSYRAGGQDTYNTTRARHVGD